MGYVIKKLVGRQRTWKVQYQTYESAYKRTAKDLRAEEYARLGFSSLHTHEQAKAHCAVLNKDESIKRLQEKRSVIDDRLSEENHLLDRHLPILFVKEFESLFIPNDSKKHRCHWRACKRVIVSVALELQDWHYYKNVFYKEFKARQFSYSYVQKIISMLNQWGRFQARKRGIYFEPIPFPRGIEKERIVDAHYDTKGSHASDPINPELLNSQGNRLTEANYNWVYLSLWLGLRPSEVDMLKRPTGPKTWYLTQVGKTQVLWVYQTKLVGIPSLQRLKPIPLKYPEQEKCLAIIQGKVFKRPLVKILKRDISDGVNCYGGRKGFTDLMLSKGNTLEAISQWLGHRSINRTWKTYKDKNKVLL